MILFSICLIPQKEVTEMKIKNPWTSRAFNFGNKVFELSKFLIAHYLSCHVKNPSYVKFDIVKKKRERNSFIREKLGKRIYFLKIESSRTLISELKVQRPTFKWVKVPGTFLHFSIFLIIHYFTRNQ